MTFSDTPPRFISASRRDCTIARVGSGSPATSASTDPPPAVASILSESSPEVFEREPEPLEGAASRNPHDEPVEVLVEGHDRVGPSLLDEGQGGPVREAELTPSRAAERLQG